MKHNLLGTPSTSPTMGGAFLKFAKGARCLTLLILALLSTNLAWGETKSDSWNLNSSSTDWIATGNEEYFKQPYGFKKANGTLTNKNISDFTTCASNGKTITSIKVGFKGLRNGTTASKITISLVDKDGNILTSGSELELTNASAAGNTAYVYSTFTTGLTGATGFMMKVTTFGKNVLINGASYEIDYKEAGAPELVSIAISGNPTKTTYETGESFDVTGLTVTGTYDDKSTAVLTNSAEWTINPATFTSTSQNSVSVTAKVDEITSPECEVTGLTVNARTPYSFGFETNTSLDWDLENMGFKQTNSDVTAHGGSYFGTTDGKASANMTTKKTVANPGTLTCYVSKQSTNTTSSTWKIQVSSDGESWTDVKSQDAKSMDKGVWVGFTADLSSYKDVYVRISYSGSTAVRCIDDVSLTLAKEIKSIEVKTAPTKTTYYVGETFSPAGLVIKATYDTGDEEIAYAGNESDFTFSPDLTTALTTANTSVTITYGGKSIGQAITVNLIKLAKPAKLQATPASTSATLTWDEVANASSYEVNINNKTLTAETNSLLVGELTASTAYTWTVKAKGDNTTYEDSESAESNFTTLAPPTVAYTVTFNGNNHGTPASESIEESSAGAGITLPNCTPNAGYQFVGWATSETATEAEYEAGATYYPTANITLYAVYNEVYTINYMVNGANTGAQENVIKGTALVFPEVSAPDADHVFCGWVTEAIEGTQATAPEYVNTDGLTASVNITYYAVFAEKSGSEPAEQKTQTLQYDTWTYYGSTTNKDTYRLFHSGSYIESAEFDLSKLSKVIVYGGSFGGGSYNSLTIGDGTNTWKSVTVSGSSQTGNNTYTDGTALSGTGKLRITSNSGTEKGGTGVRISKVEIFTMEGGYTYTNYCTTVVTKVLESISLDGNYPTEFWKGDAFSHEGMTVTAHYSNAPAADVTSKAEFTNYDMSTVGEQTVTVTYEGKTATYNITVKTIANTPGNAYTVAEAKSLIDANPAELATTEVYVKGTVSKVDSYNLYGIGEKSITYWISEDGTTTNQFEIYSGKNLNNTDFASKDDVQVGDDVVIYGKIKDYRGTYEFDAGNYLVSHVKASTLSIEDIMVEIGGTISPEITTNVPEAERTITYSVPSEDVVKVEGGNLVTVAVGGPVTVTATLTAEGYKDATTTFTVEVIKALQSIAVKDAPTNTSYKEGDSFDPAGLVITATYSDATTEDIYYEGNEDKFTFTPSLETALTTENTSVTITYAGKEATQTITVRALCTYDIAWMANGVEHATTQVTEGDALTLPETDPDDVGDMKFQGWITAENYYDASEAPEYITNETVPTGNTTYYAVFAKEVEVEGPVSNVITYDTENIPTSYAASQDYQLNGTLFNLTQVYKNGEKLQWRAAGHDSGTGTMYNKDALNKIQSIKLTYHEDDKNKNFTVNVGSAANPTEGTSITPSSSGNVYTFDCSNIEPDYFVLTNGSNAGYLEAIDINYIGKTTSYSDYCTTITAANMAITSAKWGTFCAPFDVELEEGVKAYTADASGSNVAFTEVTTTIPAGTPVVVYSEEVVNKNFAGAATVNTNNCSSGVLVGVYAETTGIAAEDGYTNYVLQNNGGVVGFYKATSTISLKANRCYMTLPTSAGIKAFFAFDDMADGICRILNSTDKAAEGIFDLNGHKLTAPRKGVNIINGVKVLVK